MTDKAAAEQRGERLLTLFGIHPGDARRLPTPRASTVNGTDGCALQYGASVRRTSPMEAFCWAEARKQEQGQNLRYAKGYFVAHRSGATGSATCGALGKSQDSEKFLTSTSRR